MASPTQKASKDDRPPSQLIPGRKRRVRLHDPVGERYGRLTVIEALPFDKGTLRSVVCRCDCGNTKTVKLADLRKGHVRSCGCLKDHRPKGNEVSERGRKLREIREKNQARVVQNGDTLVGLAFGFSVVIDDSDKKLCKCLCRCGKEFTALRTSLMRDEVVSCGCTRRRRGGTGVNPIGGDSLDPAYAALYHVWSTMKYRCDSPKCHNYANYGGRGITYCEEWKDWPTFKLWATTHGFRPGLTLDRIDNNKGYFPDNCRFVDYTVQANNRRSRSETHVEYKGRSVSIVNFCNETGLPPQWAYSCKEKGVSGDDTLALWQKAGQLVPELSMMYYNETVHTSTTTNITRSTFSWQEKPQSTSSATSSEPETTTPSKSSARAKAS